MVIKMTPTKKNNDHVLLKKKNICNSPCEKLLGVRFTSKLLLALTLMTFAKKQALNLTL